MKDFEAGVVAQIQKCDVEIVRSIRQVGAVDMLRWGRVLELGMFLASRKRLVERIVEERCR